MRGIRGHEPVSVIFEIIQSCLQWEQDLGTCLDSLEIPTVATAASNDPRQQQIVFTNTAFCRQLGYSRDEVLGRRLDTLLTPDTERNSVRNLMEGLRQEGHGQAIVVLGGSDGTRYRVERLAVRAPSWDSLDVAGDVYLYFDRPLGQLTPLESDAQVSDGTRIALQLETLLRLYIRQNYRQGMHPAQWSALRYFQLAPPDARTLTGFARAHHTTMGTASTTVSTLVGKGYLKKQGFRGSVEVTQSGETLLREDPLSYVVRALGEMSEEQRRWAQYTLSALSDAFETAED